MISSVVTGGSGFIGSHVVDELIRIGHDVSVLDAGTQPHRPDVKFLDVDLTNAEAVLSAIEGCDYLFHLGAVSDINLARENPTLCARVNVLGTINVLEAARSLGVKRVIFASTAWLYSGFPDADRDEVSPFYVPRVAPIYTSSKIASELFCHDYWRHFNQPFTILRYGTAYGPRMREPLVIHTFVMKALAGESITIFGDGNQRRNFVYVEDLALAHSLVLGDEAVNQTYNLEGAKQISIIEIAESIYKILGKEAKIEYAPERSSDDLGIGMSIAKARKELGWEPRTSLDEGLIKTIAWYRERYYVG